MKKVRQHIIFSGIVQGVGFRYRAYYAASKLGLTGWVYNMADGRVEMEVQGERTAVERLLPLLSEEEQDVYRRGRNTAPHSVPKAATRSQYQAATGFEALWGWLYLQGRTQRLNELFSFLMNSNP